MKKLLSVLLVVISILCVVSGVNANEVDLSAYSAMNMNVYQNSRVTELNANTNGTFTVSGYMFNDSNCNRKDSLYREIIFVDENNPSTTNAYRQLVTSKYNTFLNKNMTATQNGKYDLSYAYYDVTVNPKSISNYSKTSIGAMANGSYLVYMRISDGKTSYLFPLKDVTLSDGSNMENSGTLPKGFEVINQNTRELRYLVEGSTVPSTSDPTTSTSTEATKPSTPVHKYTEIVNNENTDKIANQIIGQVKSFNEFIYGYCGFPYNERYDESYDSVRGGIVQIIKAMTGKWKFRESHGKSIEEIFSEMRYSIFESEQFNIGDRNNGEYSLVLKEWMKDGHPTIDSIESIVLAKVNSSEKLDDFTKDLVAYVTSNGIEYEVSLHKEGSNYKVIDVDRLTSIRESLGSPNEYYPIDWLWDDPTLIDTEINNGNNKNEEVVFKDKNLESAIRDAINKPKGEITTDDVLNITRLTILDKNINDISGLEHLKNLKMLYIENSSISDLSPLKNLTKLTELSLFRNNISDISPLSYLTNLEKLTLAHNKIASIEALGNLTKLQELNLFNNNITNINIISKLTNLNSLSLGYNRIQNIPSLSGLTKLVSLTLENNQISDISGLTDMKKLEYLELQENKISDISPLKNNINLNWLVLSANKITDITSLKSLSNMENLYINNNNISDINVLYDMPKLSVVWMDNTKISNADYKKYVESYPNCLVRY